MIRKIMNDRELLAYIFFGGLVTVISIAVYKGCLMLGYNSAVSNTISTIIAVTVAFITNKLWVFRSLSFELLILLKEFGKFITGRLFTYVVETALLVLLVDRLMFWDLLCKTATTVLVIVLNYIISKKFVFK